MTERRYVILNTHVGASLRNGTLQKVIKWGRPDVLLLQEVNKLRHRRNLRKALGDGWKMYGQVDNFVCVRKGLLTDVDKSFVDITFGEQYTRFTASVTGLDAETGRRLSAQSVHCQPLGKGLADGAMPAVRRQQKQLKAFVAHSKAQSPGAVVVDGGDFNQDMDAPPPKGREEYAAATLWAKAKMVAANTLTPAGNVRLDEFMVRPDEYVRVVSRTVFNTTGSGDDHDAVLLVLDVEPMPKEPIVPTDVARRGTDSSGRGIFATDLMWSWWEARCFDLGFIPVITQGAWMKLAGGGAAGSAGYHDGGGTFDLRVWDRTDAEVVALVRNLRENGAAAWLRNVKHGGFTDPHIHFVFAADAGLSAGAQWQVSEYKAGRDGLASRGGDYHDRPSPLVITPPKGALMPTSEQIAEAVRGVVREEIAKADPWKTRINVWGTKGKDSLRADSMLAQAHNRAGQARDNTKGQPDPETPEEQA